MVAHEREMVATERNVEIARLAQLQP